MRQNFFLLGLLALLIGTASLFMISSHKIFFVEEILFDINVSNNITGFNLDKDKMHFGTLPSGLSSERSIDVVHNFSKTLQVHIVILGNMSSWIMISSSAFLLQPNEIKPILLSLTVPNQTDLGVHEGKIVVTFSE